jgi:hypothetical protein
VLRARGGFILTALKLRVIVKGRCVTAAAAVSRKHAPFDVLRASTLVRQHLCARFDVHSSGARPETVGAGKAEHETHLERLQPGDVGVQRGDSSEGGCETESCWSVLRPPARSQQPGERAIPWMAGTITQRSHSRHTSLCRT